jgi:hypothetical protein
MKPIPLSRGYVALVDDNDYESVSQFKWTAFTPRQMVYAVRYPTVNGKRKYVYLHRFILGVTEPTIQVDHRNHNGLDCQRHNLRIAQHKDNIRNQRKTRKPRSSKYKGVCWSKWAAKWHAQLGKAGRSFHLGYYETELAAARAYDVAATLHFGEFAHLNGV